MEGQERLLFRRRLLALLRDSFIYNREPLYTLSSGRTSRFYIDCKRVTLDPEGAFLAGQLLLDALADSELDGVGGMTLGADPLAVAVAVLSYGTDRPLRGFLVRKEPLGRGPWPHIEGSLAAGARVAIVDDVLTGGRAIERTIRIVTEAGFRVAGVWALVDRKEGGAEYLRQRGFAVSSLFTVEDLLKA